MESLKRMSTTTVPANVQPFAYDPDFKGPVKERSCTDLLCLFLFVAFLVGWAVIAAFAFKHGSPQKLIHPTDSEGNICGIDHFESKPYLFFFDLTTCARPSVVFKGCNTPQVCVKQCPSETFYVNAQTAPESIKDKLICKYKTDMKKPVGELIKDGDCATLYLNSSHLLGRCIPSKLDQSGLNFIVDKANQTVRDNQGSTVSMETITKANKFLARFLNATEFGKKIFSDFKNAWQIILIALVLCMLLSMLWVILMRWLASLMVWLSIVLVFCFSGFALYYSISMYVKLQKDPEAQVSVAFTTNLKSYLASKDTWLAFAIISGSVLLIILLMLIFLRKRILIAIALIKEASKAVGCVITSLAFPIFPYALQLSACAFFISVALYIASSGKATFQLSDSVLGISAENTTVCDPNDFDAKDAKCLFKTYGESSYALHAYNAFAFFWSVFFVIGVGEVSLGGAFAAYYWTLNKRSVPTFAMALGCWRCLRYHLGSVAFGSLLLATVRMIRVILEYIDHKCKKYNNCFTRAIMCCLKCCFWMLEKFLKLLSKNAYIMISVYGYNFCSAAKTAFELLLRNAIRVVVLDKVTDFLLFIGKLCIVGVAGTASFLIFGGKVEYFSKHVPELNYNLLPVIVITFGAYIIASLFFNVYSMAVNTLFLCFLEDCERHDGSAEKPYYMSKDLMLILDKKNKFRKPIN